MKDSKTDLKSFGVSSNLKRAGGTKVRLAEVIDLTERLPIPDFKESLRDLKVRFDLEQAKVAVSTSLLSIVILVTVANTNLLRPASSESTSLASSEQVVSEDPAMAGGGGRAIASVPGGSEYAVPTQERNQMIKDLSHRDLGPSAAYGRKPTPLERLAFEYLEGKYAIRLHAGKLHEVELSRAGDGSSEGRKFSSADEFLNSHRDLLPEYSKSVRVGEGHEGAHKIETYQLVDKVSMPVAKVQFRLDGDSRLLGLRVVTGQEVPSN